MRDCGKNLKKLPNRFHGNHPEYSKWIDRKLTELQKSGKLNKEEINKLIDEATKNINKAYDNFIKTDGKENLNQFFKKLND